MKYNYRPNSMVCSQNITIEINDGKIAEVQFTGGCPGNLIGISRLVVGMDPQQAISQLKGIQCGGKPTSCPDQLACALTEIVKQKQ